MLLPVVPTPRMRSVVPCDSVCDEFMLKLDASVGRSRMSSMPARSIWSGVIAVTAIGTSCSDSSRFVAVTVISSTNSSSSSCAHAPPVARNTGTNAYRNSLLSFTDVPP